MKTVFLVRHAKSSWKDPGLDDFDRPLNKRGRQNAPFMGNKLKERRVTTDLVLSSPAKRARKTASAIVKALGYPPQKIVFDDNMYHAGARYLFEKIRQLDNTVATVMLVGHNPGFDGLADMLMEQNPIHHLVTAGVLCVEIDATDWRELSPGKGRFIFYDYPKRYQVD